MGYKKLYIFCRVGNKTASKFIPNYFLLDNRDISGQVRVTFSIRCPCGAPTSKSFSSFFLFNLFSQELPEKCIFSQIKKGKKQKQRIKHWNKKFKETENLVDKVIKKGVRKKLLQLKCEVK